ncbi:MAG: ABC transporter permease [Lentisphaeria bacterium]|nr:ABC transporter permease [Lentisphaeria bacterium]
MKPFRAIVIQTVRSAVRSHVFHVLFAFIAIAMFGLPLMVSGDGTAQGLVQIALTYSLGVIMALVSATTVWLACSQLPREVENYTIHMVATKPCPRFSIWLGKWFGVFLMNTLIFLVSAGTIYGLVFARLAWAKYKGRVSEQDMVQLHNEVLVGRRAFQSEEPPFIQLTEAEYEKRLQEGKLDKEHNKGFVLSEIYRQLKNKSASVPPGTSKRWVFKNVSVDSVDEMVFLRYRHYRESTSRSSQRVLRGIWSIRNPEQSTKDRESLDHFPLQVLTGGYHELPIPGKYVNGDGVLVVEYANPPSEVQGTKGEAEKNNVIFQLGDGPDLLVRESGFLSNYIRTMILCVFQIAFLAALGCTVGSAFSTPVAAFVAVAYLTIGMSVQAAIDAPLKDDMGRYEYKGVFDHGAHLVARTIGKAVVSIDELNTTSDLARGRLVEISRIGGSLVRLIFIRGGLMAALGMWILTRRELGAVIRR